MPPLFFVLLALHLLGVAIAYGGTVVVPFLPGRMRAAGAELVVRRMVLPAAASLAFTGAGMILVTGINPSTQAWLGMSLGLYALTIVYVAWRQRPQVLRLLRGDRSPELMSRLKLSSLGLAAVIVTIGFLMMTKPGR